jgi:hypothetical protein
LTKFHFGEAKAVETKRWSLQSLQMSKAQSIQNIADQLEAIYDESVDNLRRAVAA